MRILFLTHYFPPEGNAPATRVHEFGRRWVAAGHHVTVITCAPNVPAGVVYEGYRNRLVQRETIDGIEVVRVWTLLAANRGTVRRTLNYLSYMLAALCVGVFQRRPDVLIATSPQLFCGVAGAVLRWVKRCPFVLEVRDIWPESIVAVGAMRRGRAVRALEAVERWMYRRAHRIVTVGPGYRERLRERGVAADRISVVTNGVDTERFRPRPADPALREGWGGTDGFVIGYVGTVGMAAGLEVVLEAARLMRERGGPAVRWVIVGDGAERASLEKRARDQGLEALVFAGLRPKAEMPAVIASLDACLVHLRPEPLFATVLPSKMFECAAMERAVILGVEGHAAELVRESGGGVVIPPGDGAALADAAARWAKRPHEARACGQRARSFFAARFDLDRLAGDYAACLNDVAGGGRREPLELGREV